MLIIICRCKIKKKKRFLQINSKKSFYFKKNAHHTDYQHAFAPSGKFGIDFQCGSIRH